MSVAAAISAITHMEPHATIVHDVLEEQLIEVQHMLDITKIAPSHLLIGDMNVGGFAFEMLRVRLSGKCLVNGF